MDSQNYSHGHRSSLCKVSDFYQLTHSFPVRRKATVSSCCPAAIHLENDNEREVQIVELLASPHGYLLSSESHLTLTIAVRPLVEMTY